MNGLQGYIHCTYGQLVAAFGPPSGNFDDDKSDAGWNIEIPDLGVADVYNWKNGRNYCGPAAPAVEDIILWNIAGDHAAVVDQAYRMISDANPELPPLSAQPLR